MHAFCAAQAAARVESEIILTRVLKAELKGEDAGYDRVQKHLRKGAASGAALEGASVKADRLQGLRTKMHEAFRYTFSLLSFDICHHLAVPSWELRHMLCHKAVGWRSSSTRT